MFEDLDVREMNYGFFRMGCRCIVGFYRSFFSILFLYVVFGNLVVLCFLENGEYVL